MGLNRVTLGNLPQPNKINSKDALLIRCICPRLLVAVNFRRGQRVRVRLNGSYRHYLDGLEGVIKAVYSHGAAVALESPPVVLQNVIGPAGSVGPVVPNQPIYVFQFSELEQVQ